MGERESYNKCIRFKKDDNYYYYESSVSDSRFPQEIAVRDKWYFMFIIFKEKDDLLLYDAFFQVDKKMKLTRAMLKKIIPKKIEQFQQELIRVINSL
jgi:hypothetical protein